jgi:hypothetical protein
MFLGFVTKAHSPPQRVFVIVFFSDSGLEFEKNKGKASLSLNVTKGIKASTQGMKIQGQFENFIQLLF